MTNAELERRLLDLERRVPGARGGALGSPGLSTFMGATSVVYRDHFPAILTSTYSSTTGYSWERIFLDRSTTSPSMITSTMPQDGSFAFTPDNDQSLAADTRGYLCADPTAGGWIFLAAGSGSVSVDSDVNELGGSGHWAMTSAGSWLDISASDPITGSNCPALTLPSAGTYLLSMTVSASAALSAGGPEHVAARLYDVTLGAVVPGSTVIVLGVSVATSVQQRGGNAATVAYTVTGASTIRLEGFLTNAATPTWVNYPSLRNNSLSGAAPGGTTIGYIRWS